MNFCFSGVQDRMLKVDLADTEYLYKENQYFRQTSVRANSCVPILASEKQSYFAGIFFFFCKRPKR